MPPRNERDRPRRVLVDEEATSVPLAPFPHGESQVSSEFPIPPMIVFPTPIVGMLEHKCKPYLNKVSIKCHLRQLLLNLEFNLLGLVCYHRILLVEVKQLWRSVHTANTFVQELMVCHKCAFGEDKLDM